MSKAAVAAAAARVAINQFKIWYLKARIARTDAKKAKFKHLEINGAARTTLNSLIPIIQNHLLVHPEYRNYCSKFRLLAAEYNKNATQGILIPPEIIKEILDFSEELRAEIGRYN